MTHPITDQQLAELDREFGRSTRRYAVAVSPEQWDGLRSRLALAEAVVETAHALMPVARACIASPREPLTALHIALKNYHAATGGKSSE